jgi:hypothetical protein
MKSLSLLVVAAAAGMLLTIPATGTVPDVSSGFSPPPSAGPDKSGDEATQIKALLQRVRETVNTAKKPEDLDPVIFEMQKYQNNGFGFNPMVAAGNQEHLPQIFAALEFTKQWQNYLSHMAAGETEQAHNDLSQLSQNNYGASLIPRSRLLALMAVPASPPPDNATVAAPATGDAQKIVDSIHTLDDLEPALGKLNEIAAQDGAAREYAQRLAPMVEVYGDLKNGLPTSVDIDFMGNVTGAGISASVNIMLLNFILQRYFDSYTGAPPAADETPAAYTHRVLNDALAGQDWILLKKALNAHEYLSRNVAAGGTDDETTGFDQMITGINQQTARQFSLAVTSYLTALKSANIRIPAKFIGNQLEAIKRDHPSDYDAGMTAYLNPPMPEMPQMQPGMNPGLYYMMMQRARAGMPMPPGFFPGASPYPAPRPSPTLQVSGVPPSNPTPKPSSPPPPTPAPGVLK